jgi:hypothetical protein
LLTRHARCAQATAAGGAPARQNAAEAFARVAAVLKAAPAPLRDEQDILDAGLPYIGDKSRRLAGEFLETGTMERLEKHRANARIVAAVRFARIPWVGDAVRAAHACVRACEHPAATETHPQTALRWAAGGARSFQDVRDADADGTLSPPLPAGRALQRLAVEHAEQAPLA